MLNDSLDWANIIQAIAAAVMMVFAGMQWKIQRMQQRQDAFHIKYDIYKKILDINKIIYRYGGLGNSAISLSNEKSLVYQLIYELENEFELVFSKTSKNLFDEYRLIIFNFDELASLAEDDYHLKNSNHFRTYKEKTKKFITQLKSELSVI